MVADFVVGLEQLTSKVHRTGCGWDVYEEVVVERGGGGGGGVVAVLVHQVECIALQKSDVAHYFWRRWTSIRSTWRPMCSPVSSSVSWGIPSLRLAAQYTQLWRLRLRHCVARTISTVPIRSLALRTQFLLL